MEFAVVPSADTPTDASPPFDHQSVRRIVASVKYTEDQSRNQTDATGDGVPPIPFLFRRFELAEALDPSMSTTTGYFLKWDSDTADYVADTDTTIILADPTGSRRGRAKDAYSTPHDQGNRGWCIKPHDVDIATGTDRWEIIWMQPNALMILGQATGAVAAGNSTFTLDGVVVLNPTGGLITDTNPGGNITTENIHAWELDNNAQVQAQWDEDGTRWIGVQGDCPV